METVSMIVATLLASTILLQSSIISAATTAHIVGDSTGWTIPPNTTFYSGWASSNSIASGDILVFQFPPGIHNVVEVTKAGYDACSTTKQIGSTLTNGPAAVTVTSDTHYYICGFPGHCSAGMKLAVTVAAAAVATAPSKPPTASKPATAPSKPPPASKPATAPSKPPTASKPAPAAVPTSVSPAPAAAPKMSGPTASSPVATPESAAAAPAAAPKMSGPTASSPGATPAMAPVTGPTTASSPAPAAGEKPASSPPAGSIQPAASGPSGSGTGTSSSSALRSATGTMLTLLAVAACLLL